MKVVASQIVDAAYRVPTTLGPGLLESSIRRHWQTVAPVHNKQLLTYLKLADKRLGLRINFNVTLIKAGITRIANGLKE